MGFRTIVALSNDQAHEWQKDPLLGEKIWQASCELFSPRETGLPKGWLGYGSVIEQVHADTQTVIFADGYGGKPMAHSHWYSGQTEEQKELAMLKALADKLGYRVSIKSDVKLARALAGAYSTKT